MASYYEAPCLRALRDELNEAHPNRDKSSDGWIGDPSHQARKSDHNPDYDSGGVVRARDTDKDGIDADRLVALAIKDSRVQYVIWAGHIWSRTYGFRKRKYNGSNQHYSHVHISIRHGKRYENDTRSWGYLRTDVPKPTKSVETVAKEVLAGKWGNNPQRRQKLEAQGYDYAKVQAEVTRLVNERDKPKPPTTPKKPLAEVAAEVLAGEWGNGDERKNRLTAKGYNYAAVQIEVRRLIEERKPKRKTVAEIVDEVIAGKWGNGPTRKARLRGAGYNYAVVQAAVTAKLAGKKSVEEVANEVLDEKWGKGDDRVSRLKESGYDPDEVQKVVNRKLDWIAKNQK